MASQTLQKVRSEALDLSEADRAELAYDLVLSLDGPADEGVSQAWEEELTRRMDELEAGTATLVDRAEHARRMRDRLSRS
jgi:putative addiction module component (TIGR02574 family)